MRFFTSRMFFSILVCYLSCALCEQGPVLFLCSKINYAWGYFHEGWYIDTSGVIHNYSFSQSDSVGYARENDTLPSKIYDMLLAHSTPSGKSVTPDTLRSKTACIESAGGGILSKSGICADAGMRRYSAFSYDAQGLRPKEIICYQAGDVGICNSAPAARKIARWLSTIDSLDSRFCAPPDSCLNFTTSIARESALIRNERFPMVMYGHTIRTDISSHGTTVIRVYTLRGELLATQRKRFPAAGGNRITLRDLLPGIQSEKPVIVEISTDDVTSVLKTVAILPKRYTP
jgi:hypothetical protein